MVIPPTYFGIFLGVCRQNHGSLSSAGCWPMCKTVQWFGATIQLLVVSYRNFCDMVLWFGAAIQVVSYGSFSCETVLGFGAAVQGVYHGRFCKTALWFLGTAVQDVYYGSFC
jgi:hypothetical protein